jgi:hypothetical protein
MPKLVGKTVSKLCLVWGGFKGLYGRLVFGLAGAVENPPFYTSFMRVVMPMVFGLFLSDVRLVLPSFHKTYYNNDLFNSFNSIRRTCV